MASRAHRDDRVAKDPVRHVRVITSGKMYRTGRSDGRQWYLRLGLRPVGSQEPYPSRDDPRLPHAVEECRAAAHEEAARLENEFIQRRLRLEQRIAADEETVAAVNGRTLPERRRRLSPWIYAGVLAGLGLAEWVVNAYAFAIFGSANYVTFIVALVVAVLLPLCAHLTGAAWKQRQHLGIAVLSLSIAVSIIFALALVRQAFFYSYVQGLLNLNVGPRLLTVIYLVINLGMFGGGVAASYSHAERDPEGQDKRRRVAAAQKRLTADRKILKNLAQQYRALCNQQTIRLRGLAHAYNRGNLCSRRRSRQPEHREQPVWVDRIRDLEVPIPESLLERRTPTGRGGDPVPPAVPTVATGNGGNGHRSASSATASEPVYIIGFDNQEGQQ